MLHAVVRGLRRVCAPDAQVSLGGGSYTGGHVGVHTQGMRPPHTHSSAPSCAQRTCLFALLPRFDVVVIDEAAQAVEPATLVPILNGCKQVRGARPRPGQGAVEGAVEGAPEGTGRLALCFPLPFPLLHFLSTSSLLLLRFISTAPLLRSSPAAVPGGRPRAAARHRHLQPRAGAGVRHEPVQAPAGKQPAAPFTCSCVLLCACAQLARRGGGAARPLPCTCSLPPCPALAPLPQPHAPALV